VERPKASVLQIVVATIICIILFVGGWLVGSIQGPELETNNDEEVRVAVARVRDDLRFDHEQKIADLKADYEQQILELEKLLAEAEAKVETHVEVIVEVEKETVSLEQFTQIVRRNDTIWGYAARLQNPPQNDYVQRIIDLNQVNPYLLQIGQEIIVPLP